MLVKCLGRFRHKHSINVVVIIVRCLKSESKYQLKKVSVQD